MMQHWRLDPDDPTEEVLTKAVATLRDGGILAIPTETYYGLAGALSQRRALEHIQRVKGRGRDKPLLLLVSGPEMVRSLTDRVPDSFSGLADAFWPGPLTLVVPAREGLPTTVVSPAGGVAVRMSPDPTVAALLVRLGEPISGTSANPGGHPPARTADEIEPMEGIAAVLDTGPTPGGPPSTLLDLTPSAPEILREGAIAPGELAEVLS